MADNVYVRLHDGYDLQRETAINVQGMISDGPVFGPFIRVELIDSYTLIMREKKKNPSDTRCDVNLMYYTAGWYYDNRRYRKLTIFSYDPNDPMESYKTRELVNRAIHFLEPFRLEAVEKS